MSHEYVTGVPALHVSVHARTPGEAPGEPLAYGFMVGPASVLVPDPPEDVASPWKRYLVRISRSPGADDATETIPVGGISLAAVNDHEVITAAAVLTLVWPTEFEVADVSSTPVKLAELLTRHHGDQWAAYADLGLRVARPKKESGPQDTWWLGRADGVVVVRSVERYAWGTCGTSPTCGRHSASRSGVGYPASAD
ncbi:hypothetical protein ACFXAF_16185 [Kitasatospora sp. NPDC059463]|uniref:hypothetical protein n=1 Tax=unclassified Kitasatospora TaxID=2633591 RepID=UPI00369546AB